MANVVILKNAPTIFELKGQQKNDKTAISDSHRCFHINFLSGSMIDKAGNFLHQNKQKALYPALLI